MDPRLHPKGPQPSALARAFGCARVVSNDALRAREIVRAAGEAFPKTGDLSKLLITEAKLTEARVARRGVRCRAPAVPAGPGRRVPELLRRAEGQAPAHGRAPVQVPQGQPAGRMFHRDRPMEDHRRRRPVLAEDRGCAGEVVPRPSLGPLHGDRDQGCGRKVLRELRCGDRSRHLCRERQGRRIDLGLGHFAVLSDGTKIDAPRFLRRAEKKPRASPLPWRPAPPPGQAGATGAERPRPSSTRCATATATKRPGCGGSRSNAVSVS
ncbi:helix-turn-helix domain-containing protein [Streptomyces sp. DASNCL29]|uniref:helix-turn-helix domain-containing protein n=1 Tax=Streptomyces sp. DASNCL29 TaxID=2583819 RepID=UPI003211E4D1